MRKIALSLTLSAMAVLTSTTLMAANTQMILNQTPTPVKGIWYALAQKFNGIPKYSGGFATYTANHTPMAIERNGDVYYTFAQDGPAGTMQVGVAVLRGSTAQTSVQILRTEMASRDPHQNVTLSIDDAGYVYVYQSARNNDPAPSMQGLIWKSVTPYTLPTASHLLGAGHNRAYLQPWQIAGQQVQVFTQYAGELNGPKVRHQASTTRLVTVPPEPDYLMPAVTRYPFIKITDCMWCITFIVPVRSLLTIQPYQGVNIPNMALRTRI